MQDTTCHMSMSLDGFVAGPEQSREDPLGKRGRELHRWHLGDERANEADETAAGWLMRPRGAYLMGRNMFGPIRGEWEEDWRGWWGPEPPYHAPVFVLTHHAREPIEMEGGTTFHFVTGGFDAAYAQARETAGDDGVDIAGGAWTVRQALIAGVVDELTLDIAPVLLGSGERIFDGVESSAWSRWRCCIRRWPRTSGIAGRARAGGPSPGVGDAERGKRGGAHDARAWRRRVLSSRERPHLPAPAAAHGPTAPTAHGRRAFREAVTAAGIDGVHLRHAFASLLAHERRSAPYIADQLGHGVALSLRIGPRRRCAGRPLTARTPATSGGSRRAADEARTRDPQLGKLMLYQLSYRRRVAGG